MDIYDDDIISFWKELNKYQVEFIIIGGFAINIHGYNRSTADIDVWVNDTPANRKKLAAALEKLLIAPAEIVERMRFVPGWTQMSLANGFPLDIMTELKGLEAFSFDECLELAIKPEIDGITVPFLHINHLIAAKKAANRPKDQLDIIELEKIKAYLENNGDV
jgi:predicted nucleotidyltransferase